MSRLQTRGSLAVAIVLAAAASAQGAIVESESNNTLATADALGYVPTVPFSDVGTPSLGNGSDVDWFNLTLNAGDFLTVNTAPIQTPFTVPDTIAAVVSPAGLILASDDDDGQGTGSSFTLLAPVTGVYSIAISGFGDFLTSENPILQPLLADINGLTGVGSAPHGEVGSYILTVSVIPVIPEPATLGALAAVGTLALRRRK